MFRELLSQISDYLAEEITLEQLEDWLALQSPSLLHSPDTDVRNIAALLELGLAEMGIGERSEEEFRSLLREEVPVLPSLWRVWDFNLGVARPLETITGSSGPAHFIGRENGNAPCEK